MAFVITFRKEAIGVDEVSDMVEQALGTAVDKAMKLVRMTAKIKKMGWPKTDEWTVGNLIETSIENCGAIIIIIQSRDGARMLIATNKDQDEGEMPQNMTGLTVPVLIIDLAVVGDRETRMQMIQSDYSVAHAETLFIPRQSKKNI